MLDTVAEKKFLLLKKRLDALHYSQPFSIDSAALVERLFNDLIKTTEGFQALKKTNEELKLNVTKAEQKCEPIKAENRRLTKENNELHMEMIRIKEDAEFKESRWKNILKSFEGDKADLKHVIQLKEVGYSKLLDENAALRKKLELLIKKQYLGPGKGLDNVPADLRSLISEGKTGKFELTKPLKPNKTDKAEKVEEDIQELRKTGKEDLKAWADTVQQADDRVNTLKEEIKSAAEKRASLEQTIAQLEVQVSNRDKEIKRLQAKLEVGEGSVEKIGTEYNIKTNSEKIEKLNSQIDFLTKENFALEARVQEMKKELSRTEHLRTHNTNLEFSIKELTQKSEELMGTLKQKDRVLDKMRDTRAQADSELIEKKNRQIQELEDEVLKLCRKMEEISLENTKFRAESSQAGQTISAYNSDKLLFNEIIQDLKKSKADLETTVEELRAKLDKKDLENHRIQDELNMSQGKVQSLQREIELLQLNMNKNTEDQRYTHEVSSTLRGRISELETENLALNGQRKDLEAQIERANKLREHVEEQLERLKNESYKSKVSIESATTGKHRFQTLYEEAQKDIEFLKKDNKELMGKYLEEKKTTSELDLKCNEYFHNLRSAQEKIKGLEREIELLNEQISMERQEVRRSESSKLELEREVVILKTNSYKLEEHIEKNRRLKEDIKVIETEKTRDLRKIEELNFEIRELREKVSRQEEVIRKERQSNDELNIKIESLMVQSEQIDSNLRRAREREQDYERLLVDLESGKRREKELAEENERLRRDLRKQENLVAYGTRQVESLNQQKEDLLAQIDSLNEDINVLKTNDNEVKTRSIRLQEKTSNYEIMVADLRDEKIKVEKRLVEVEEELRRTGYELDNERRRTAELNDQVQQFKTLSESLENTKEELLLRLQNKNNERGLEEGEKLRLQDEIKKLREKVASLDEEIREARSTLVEIDRERDGLQEQLDIKTENLERVRRRCDEQEEELRRFKEKNLDFMASNEVHLTRLQDLEVQLKELHRKNRTLLDENNELRQSINFKETEIQRLSTDLHVITRENKNISQKLVTLVEEKERTKDALGSVNNQERIMRQTLRAIELEKEDLGNNYKNVCLENERLRRGNDELKDENEELSRKMREYERDSSYLRAQIQQLEVKESEYLNELAAYERSTSTLNRRLEQSEFKIKEVQEAKERLVRDLTQIRQLNEGIEYSKEDLQRDLIKCQQEKLSLQDEIRELRTNQEILRRQVDEETRRAQELEDRLTEERNTQYKQNRNIQTLENDKEELRREIENCERRIRTLQNSLTRGNAFDTFNSRESGPSVDLNVMQRSTLVLETKLNEQNAEMENLRNEQRSLRDENSKLKLSLFKLETERNEYEKKLKLQESFDNTFRSSYGKLFAEGSSVKDRYERDVVEKKVESESFKESSYKRNQESVSLSSQYLKNRSIHRGQSPDITSKKSN